MIATELKPASKAKQSAPRYKTAYVAQPGMIGFRELELPAPAGDEVLVRLIGCGLCASNIPVWEGREWFSYPMEAGAPGHEGWGIVEDTGPGVAHLKPGHRVALINGNVFSEYVLAREEDTVQIPEELADVPFPGEPFGCVMNIMKRAGVHPGHTVCVVGLGFIGLSLISLISKAGARVIALSRRSASLELALRLGADEVVPMDDHLRIIEKVKALTGGNGCERVIECTGKQWPLDLSGELAATYGRIIIAGYHQDGLRHANMQMWNWKCLDVINAHERSLEKYKEGIREAATAIINGELNPDLLLTHTFRFEDLASGMDLLTTCPDGFVKAYIKFR